MPRFQKILALVDPASPFGSVSDLLIDFLPTSVHGEEMGTVALLCVVPRIGTLPRLLVSDAAQFEEGLRALIDRRLERLSLALAGARPGWRFSYRVVQGRQASVAVTEFEAGGHDLMLVVDPQGDGRPASALDLQLLRTVPGPVWIVRQLARPGARHRVLAAVDPAPPVDESDIFQIEERPDPAHVWLDDQILDVAEGLATGWNAEVFVLHAWSVPGVQLLSGEALLDPTQIQGYVQSVEVAQRDAFSKLLARHPVLGDSSHQLFVEGDPSLVLVEKIRELEIDLVVLGTVARSGISRIVLGNTAETLARHSTCSVLALKPV